MSDRSDKSAKKDDTTRQELISDLQEMIGGIDEEGLLYLIKQANVLLYNQRVTRLNKRMKNIKGTGAEKKATSSGKAAEAQEMALDDGEVDEDADIQVVEREKGHFFIIINGFHIYFDRDEMRSLVRICHAALDGSEGAFRMYRWFKENRQDLLIDGKVRGSSDYRLGMLYDHLVSTYRVRE
jgi:hypothetical protein